MSSGPNTSPPNKKPLFHPKGHLTRALWSDQSVLYRENPPVHQLPRNRHLAEKLEHLLLEHQRQQDANYAACPKLKKLFAEHSARPRTWPKRRKRSIPVSVAALLRSIRKVLARMI